MIKRNLLTSLILYEKVRTTKKRAQVIGPMVDTLVAAAKRLSTMNAIRYLQRVVTDKNASRKIMEVFVKRYARVPSGLTRIVPVGSRKGDGAMVVDLLLVAGDAVVVEEKAKKKERNSKIQKSKKNIVASPSTPASVK